MRIIKVFGSDSNVGTTTTTMDIGRILSTENKRVAVLLASGKGDILKRSKYDLMLKELDMIVTDEGYLKTGKQYLSLKQDVNMESHIERWHTCFRNKTPVLLGGDQIENIDDLLKLKFKRIMMLLEEIIDILVVDMGTVCIFEKMAKDESIFLVTLATEKVLTRLMQRRYITHNIASIDKLIVCDGDSKGAMDEEFEKLFPEKEVINLPYDYRPISDKFNEKWFRRNRYIISLKSIIDIDYKVANRKRRSYWRILNVPVNWLKKKLIKAGYMLVKLKKDDTWSYKNKQY